MSIKYVHTNIIAKDWKALSNFYIDVFDCKLKPPQRDQEGNWLSVGTGVENAHLMGVHLLLPGHGENGPTLEIYSYANMEDKLSPKANRMGLGHLAFEVEDIEATLNLVLAHGGKKLGELSSNSVKGVGVITFIYVCDPENNIIELQNWNKT